MLDQWPCDHGYQWEACPFAYCVFHNRRHLRPAVARAYQAQAQCAAAYSLFASLWVEGQEWEAHQEDRDQAWTERNTHQEDGR